MKKYITIAALLAVGSAFANAADSYVWTGTAGDNDWLTTGNWNLNGTASESFPNGNNSDKTAGSPDRIQVEIGDNYTVNLGEGKHYLSSLIVTIGENSKLSVGVADPKVFNSTIYLSGEIAYTGDIWLGLPNDANRNYHPGVATEYILETEEAVVSFGGNVNQAVSAVLDFTYDFETYSETLQVNTKTLITSSSASLSGLLDSTSFIFNNAAVVQTVVSDITNDDIGKYWLAYGTDNKSIVLHYISGIPEPSAFGLLAGLGALALVGTRRRRK